MTLWGVEKFPSTNKVNTQDLPTKVPGYKTETRHAFGEKYRKKQTEYVLAIEWWKTKLSSPAVDSHRLVGEGVALRAT